MDQGFIDEVIARVVKKVREAEAEPAAEPAAVCETQTEAAAPAADGRKGLLILTGQHGTHCHMMLESKKLAESFQTCCALTQEYQCDPADYDVVIAYNLTCEAMADVAGGSCGTPYTKLLQKAILLGKKVFIPTEEVELYEYAGKAPAVYYAMMQEKLRLLTDSGVTICPAAEIEERVSGTAEAAAAGQTACPCEQALACASGTADSRQTFTKRVLSERDVIEFNRKGCTCICVGTRTIVTDLAREHARDSGIKIERA